MLQPILSFQGFCLSENTFIDNHGKKNNEKFKYSHAYTEHKNIKKCSIIHK